MVDCQDCEMRAAAAAIILADRRTIHCTVQTGSLQSFNIGNPTLDLRQSAMVSKSLIRRLIVPMLLDHSCQRAIHGKTYRRKHCMQEIDTMASSSQCFSIDLGRFNSSQSFDGVVEGNWCHCTVRLAGLGYKGVLFWKGWHAEIDRGNNTGEVTDGF